MVDSYISSCLNELDPLLARLVEEKGLMSRSQVEEYGWTAVLWYLDDQRQRNVELSHYNPRDIQVQLRMLTEGVGRPENRYPFESGSNRAVSTYAQDLRIFRNRKMHYAEMDRNDAVRIYDTAARLFEVLNAPEQQKWCENQLERVHAELFGAGTALPSRRELNEEVIQASSTARAEKTEVSAPRGAFTRPARPGSNSSPRPASGVRSAAPSASASAASISPASATTAAKLPAPIPLTLNVGGGPLCL